MSVKWILVLVVEISAVGCYFILVKIIVLEY